MGKVKDIVISLGHSRRTAEEIEIKLQQAGIGKEEQEKKEDLGLRKGIKTKNISETVSSE